MIKQAQRDWLDDDVNADRWHGHGDPFTAKERRILITHWVGNAYERVISDKYAEFRRKMWEKTGCLITADGSEDEKISPEGLPGYAVHPPLPIDAMDAAPTVNVVDERNAEGDGEIDEDDDEEPLPPTEKVDSEGDRVTTPPLVGRKVKGVYENGVFDGVIEYFNTLLEQYMVKYQDGTDDYITEADIDGVDIILV